MRSDALDIIIESRGPAVWLRLSGPFHNQQTPGIREKIMGLLQDGNRQIVVDLEGVTQVDPSVVPAFLQLLNVIREKGGELKLIFTNENVSKAFSSYRNLFLIYPDATSLESSPLMSAIKQTGRVLFRKTGVRISRSVAVFIVVVLCGWFGSLAIIVQIQNSRIQAQNAEVRELTQWKNSAEAEIQALQDRLRPMVQLGLLPDSLLLSPPRKPAPKAAPPTVAPATDSAPIADTSTHHPDAAHAESAATAPPVPTRDSSSSR
jgi:anti-anti-sigma factor